MNIAVIINCVSNSQRTIISTSHGAREKKRETGRWEGDRGGESGRGGEGEGETGGREGEVGEGETGERERVSQLARDRET